MLLVWRPRAYPGDWELLILQKAAISIALFAFFRDDGAMFTAWSDAVLTVALVAAYVLSRGWLEWKRPRSE